MTRTPQGQCAVQSPNPPFGRPHPEAQGRCGFCPKKATHHHKFWGWVCKAHLKVKTPPECYQRKNQNKEEQTPNVKEV